MRENVWLYDEEERGRNKTNELLVELETRKFVRSLVGRESSAELQNFLQQSPNSLWIGIGKKEGQSRSTSKSFNVFDIE